MSRPLPGVHQGLHRVPQARLRRVHRPPEEGRRRHHRGAAHAAPPRGDRGQRAARSPHPEGGHKLFDPAYLFDEGSTVSWIPCGRKLTCSFPGIKFFYGPDTYYGEEVSVLEMDGQFDKLEELIYV